MCGLTNAVLHCRGAAGARLRIFGWVRNFFYSLLLINLEPFENGAHFAPSH
jgi:hypothetical protein